MNEFKDYLKKGLKEFKIEILNELPKEHPEQQPTQQAKQQAKQQLSMPSEQQLQLMQQHSKELIAWNKKINLTAIKETKQIAEKHFIDCIVASAFITNEKTIVDIGSGGGFPGIPLKVMNPALKVVLIDSSRKKVNFLKHVIRMLNLKDIEAIHSRVQDLHENSLYKAQFDAVISRAFTELSNFVDLASPFLNKKGTIYAMKGKLVKDEMTPAILKMYKVKTGYYMLPFEKSDRYMIQLSI